MKRLNQTLPLLLAAALQLFPLLRNIITVPSAGSSFAIILRWGIGSALALDTVDAVSGATNYFTSSTNMTATVGTPFTTNLTLHSSGTDSGAVATIVSNTVNVSLIANGQSTNFAMPPGLTFKFVDSGTSSGVYDVISGTPTRAGTNLFRVDMSFPGYAVVSGYFTLTVLSGGGAAPVISTQPINLTNLVGSSATFSVTNGGASPFGYQWYFNTNTALLNQTNSAVTLANVQLTNAGMYSVIITNTSGSVTSSFASLTVWQAPVITNQPVSVTNVAGANGAFNVVAGGVPTLTYQWIFNTNTTLISSTNASLTLTGIRASQAGAYAVVITNSAGSVTSSVANLVITNPVPPIVTTPTKNAGLFQFTFVPVVGLTNSVLTNNVLAGGVWGVLTNVAPPATTNAVTITDSLGASNLFYRIQIIP